MKPLTPSIISHPQYWNTHPSSKILQRSKTSRVYISHKIESAIPFGEIKYGNRQRLSNIFDTLVTNNAYLNLNTFCTRKEHSVGFFAHINPKITLRDNFRN